MRFVPWSIKPVWLANECVIGVSWRVGRRSFPCRIMGCGGEIRSYDVWIFLVPCLAIHVEWWRHRAAVGSGLDAEGEKP